MTKTQKAISLAIITALISGFSIFFNKFAVDAIKQPLVFTTIKNTGVALLILTVLLYSRKWQKIKLLTGRQLIFLVLIGIIGGSIPFYLFFTGLSTIPAINGAIIQKTLVIWVSFLAIPLLKEKISIGRILAVVTLFLANILVGGFAGFKFTTGELYVLIATLFWSVEIILAKKILPKVDPDIVTAARMGLGAIILIIMSALMQSAALGKSLVLTPVQSFWVLLSIILLFAYVTAWYRALQLAPAITVTSILVGSTLVTNVLSAVFVTHTYNLTLVVQSLLITGGIYFIYRTENKLHSDKISPAG